MNIEEKVLHVNATIDPDNPNIPLVYWRYEKAKGTLGVNEARERALKLFEAAAIAETEVRIAKEIAKSTGNGSRGFDPTYQKRLDIETAKILAVIRQSRPQLPEGLEIIYGFKTREPLINLFWYGEQMQWEPERLRHHATALIECAESSESDRWFYIFLGNTMGLQPEEVNQLLQDFAKFRQSRSLEELFNR
jgi:hypothetical protein